MAAEAGGSPSLGRLVRSLYRFRFVIAIALLLFLAFLLTTENALSQSLSDLWRYNREFSNKRDDACGERAFSSYKSTDKSMSQRTDVPHWFRSARFGIFIHWGLYSVPGWAETEHSFEDFNKGVSPRDHFFKNPYAEWYLNTVRLAGSGAEKHHRQTYGEDPAKTAPGKWYYDRFSKRFDDGLDHWKPEEWAALFAESGAGYVVLTTKHHDGYCLWPTKVDHPRWSKWAGKASAPRFPSRRDIVGDLTKAVRAEGLQMGLYYSGGLDWSFQWKIDACFDDPTGKAHCHPGVPDTAEYATYAGAQLEELIRQYRPAILWDDINWPKQGKSAAFGKFSLPELFAMYFNQVCPAGVVNDRWKLPGKWSGDFGTPEYQQGDVVQAHVFETCRGIGKSFGFNRVEEKSKRCAAYMTVNQVIELLISTVATNGNLLLDVGPDESGRIPRCQAAVLRGVGAWLKRFGKAVLNTVPYLPVSSKVLKRLPVRITQSLDRKEVFALILPNRVRSGAGRSAFISLDIGPGYFELTVKSMKEANVWLPNGSIVTVAAEYSKENDVMNVFLPWLTAPRSGAWVIAFGGLAGKPDILDCRKIDVGACTVFV